MSLSFFENVDDKLFESLLNNQDHTLHKLYPDRLHKLTYTLRPSFRTYYLVAYLTATSLSGNSLKTFIDYFHNYVSFCQVASWQLV